MQATISDRLKTGIFIKELKNRFLCEVEINSEPVVCYVPSSCHLSNFLDLNKKEVLLVPTTTPHSRTKYALFAVPYKQSYIVLNTSMANRAIETRLESRAFSFLGKRKKVYREQTIAGYKCDFYIEDTDTIIEIKSLISTDAVASFPTVYSERTVKQLRMLKALLMKGKKVYYFIVSLHPYVKTVAIDSKSEFFSEIENCIELGMSLKAFTSRLKESGLMIEHQIPIKID